MHNFYIEKFDKGICVLWQGDKEPPALEGCEADLLAAQEDWIPVHPVNEPFLPLKPWLAVDLFTLAYNQLCAWLLNILYC